MIRSLGRRMLVPSALLTMIALAGCAQTPGGSVVGSADPSPSASPTAEPGLKAPIAPVTDPEILAYCPAEAATHFDGDIEAVTSITVCSVDELQSVEQTGSGTIERASRVDTGGAELLKAYSLPNAIATDGPCIALAADPLIVWLTVGDTIQPVYAPVDECGFPTDAAAAAYAGLTLVIITQTSDSTVTPVDPGD